MDWKLASAFCGIIGIIAFAIAMFLMNVQVVETGIAVQDLNSSSHSEHSILASLIVQGAMLNKIQDANDVFVQQWQSQCRLVQQDQNFAYFVCKVK